MYPGKFKFTVLICICLLFWNLSYSQQREDLIGDWKVIKVELSPNARPEEKQMLETLNSIFLKSTFQFKEKNAFSLESTNKELAIKDAIWQIDVEKKYVKVTERASKGVPGLLMEFTVKAQNGNYLFYMEETPLILTVAKKTP